jgi:hypothetical protein
MKKAVSIKLFILLFILITNFATLLKGTSANNADGKQFKGEIVGVHAKARFEELTSGEIKNLAYGGKLAILLEDGKKVDATCPEKFLSDLKGCPEFKVKEIHGGLVASVTIKLEEKQKVLLIRKQSDEWEVKKILKEFGNKKKEFCAGTPTPSPQWKT